MLIRNATIVTQNPARDIVQADISVEDGRIAEIGKIAGDADIDATGMIAIPGMVNTHTHVAMTLLRGYGEGLPLHKWLEEKIWPAEAKQTPEDVKAGAELAFCEMIRSGTTAFAEMCIHDTKPIFQAAEKAGMRGIISKGVLDFNDSSNDVLSSVKPTLDYGTEMLKPFIAAHAPYTCSEELLVKSKEFAVKKNLKYQIHAAETRKEVFDILDRTGKYPFEYLESIGLMDSDSTFIHGGWLTKREIALAGKKKTNLSSCPVSNLKLATGGIAQITELDASEVNVCLGTDSAASNNSLDMFETMKFAALLQKHHYWKADIITEQKIFDFATVNGAQALGLETGSIEPGKPADIVIINPGSNISPGNDVVAGLVYSAGPQNVRDVIINGRIVMQEGKLLTLDEQAVVEKANELAPCKKQGI
jgi:5-methylthioadenosine/S-adenosylhomocysteine deaminase